MTDKMWRPKPEDVATSQMTRFQQFVEQQTGLAFEDYQQLHTWSVQNPVDFWQAIAEFHDVILHEAPATILLDGDKMPGATWFSGATLNFAENLLRHTGDKPAIIFHNETSERIVISYDELRQQVAQFANYLKQCGVGVHDRVAGFLPNRPETIIAMLATTSLGAVWSSCSPDFGYHGVFDRFRQIEPKVLIGCDGHYYNGKAHSAIEKLAQLRDNISSIEHLVLVPNIREPDTAALGNAVTFEQAIFDRPTELNFTPVAFDHPLYIMFSSGTTGVPKCIVHGTGGTLLQHVKELVLHTNLTADDTITYFTTCGWMMWNWLVSSLATGATIVLYDGSPLHPDATRLFDLIDAENISIFGTSAKYITAVEKQNVRPRDTHQLTSLRTILSTGSPLVPKNFDFVYQNIKENVCLSSISGGTDIISCFALGNPNLPVFRGELQCIGLGMNVAVFDENGKALRQGKGELVCLSPFPSMPIYFWNDPDGSKFRATYFEKFSGAWAHGDYAELTDHGGLIIYGRSDTVLNPGGVRIGTAEIYRQVEAFPEILESIVVGQPIDHDERVILFIKLRNGDSLTDRLTNEIRTRIKQNVSPHHVPAEIISVPDIPRTISGKIVELAVRNVVTGQKITNLDAIANPEALKYFEL